MEGGTSRHLSGHHWVLKFIWSPDPLREEDHVPIKGGLCFLQPSLPLGWQVLWGDEEQLRRRVGYIRDQSGEWLLHHMGVKHLGLNIIVSPSLLARRRGHKDQSRHRDLRIRAVLLCGKQREKWLVTHKYTQISWDFYSPVQRAVSRSLVTCFLNYTCK